VDDDWTADELVEVEVEVEAAVELAVEVKDEVVGMLWALTAANTPTPPIAAKATPAVMRFMRRMAESRALIRPPVPSGVLSMAATVAPTSGTWLRDSCEIAVSV
jgi:hypothetical protein